MGHLWRTRLPCTAWLSRGERIAFKEWHFQSLSPNEIPISKCHILQILYDRLVLSQWVLVCRIHWESIRSEQVWTVDTDGILLFLFRNTQLALRCNFQFELFKLFSSLVDLVFVFVYDLHVSIFTGFQIRLWTLLEETSTDLYFIEVDIIQINSWSASRGLLHVNLSVWGIFLHHILN